MTSCSRWLSISLLFLATSAAPRPEADLSGLSWLAGHWVSETGERVVEEIWTEPAATRMLGMNHTVERGASRAFEFLRIERREGGLFFIPSPGGRLATTVFALAELSERRVVFENEEHDFPQRIIYERAGDRLHARVEGIVDGEQRSSSWLFEMRAGRHGSGVKDRTDP